MINENVCYISEKFHCHQMLTVELVENWLSHFSLYRIPWNSYNREEKKMGKIREKFLFSSRRMFCIRMTFWFWTMDSGKIVFFCVSNHFCLIWFEASEDKTKVGFQLEVAGKKKNSKTNPFVRKMFLIEISHMAQLRNSIGINWTDNQLNWSV